MTSTHYTAWLTMGESCLDQPNCDLTVLPDEITTYDVSSDGDETPVWGSTGSAVFYGITSIPADGDIDAAIREAKAILADAGWTAVGDWDATDNAYVITVERSDPDEEWTLAEAARQIGATTTGSARKTLSRWEVIAVRREPGRGGQSVYRAVDVIAAMGARPGQGARTDLADH